MRLQQNENTLISCMKAFGAFACLCIVVLLVNYPIISFDMMYEEQPILYLVNQKITSFYDLIQIYLHPAMLEVFAIPFFRPSGHFLMYQLITTFLDWHNTKGFLVVNFFFLALTCHMMIKLYALLFPRFRLGGYIACAVYLLHPALALSRLTPMHFEFACTFFSVLSLYFFVLFCQTTHQQMPFKHPYLLLISLVCYVISVTFKETALMLAPVMVIYLSLSLLKNRATALAVLQHTEARQITLLLTIMALILATYLSMAWPSFSHPFQHAESTASPIIVLTQFLKILFGFWTNPTFPAFAQWALRVMLVLLVTGSYFLLCAKQKEDRDSLFRRKKSFLFLLLAALAFMAMPIVWARGRPWHLALSLVFFSMMIGFCIDYLSHCLCQKILWRNTIQIAFVIAFCLTAFAVANSNVIYFNTAAPGFASRVDRNAVLHPPALKAQLNAESVLIVEDSIIHNDYLLGDSVYPVEPFVNEIDLHRLLPAKGFYQFPFVYGGTLFKWAYLLPQLHEQVYSFQIDKMQTIPSITLYNWLQHYANIFCVGYDSRGEWHDRTIAFKQNLLREKARRHLVISHYKMLPVKTLAMNATAFIRLPFPDPAYCQFRCDANKNCKGFTYVQSNKEGEAAACYFRTATRVPGIKACEACKLFIKV